MYGATISGLMELLAFYFFGSLAFCFCLAAVGSLGFGGSSKTSRLLAIGGLVCSAISGFAFSLLLSARILSQNAGASLGYLLLIPTFVAIAVFWFKSGGSK